LQAVLKQTCENMQQIKKDKFQVYSVNTWLVVVKRIVERWREQISVPEVLTEFTKPSYTFNGKEVNGCYDVVIKYFLKIFKDADDRSFFTFNELRMKAIVQFSYSWFVKLFSGLILENGNFTFDVNRIEMGATEIKLDFSSFYNTLQLLRPCQAQKEIKGKIYNCYTEFMAHSEKHRTFYEKENFVVDFIKDILNEREYWTDEPNHKWPNDIDPSKQDLEDFVFNILRSLCSVELSSSKNSSPLDVFLTHECPRNPGGLFLNVHQEEMAKAKICWGCLSVQLNDLCSCKECNCEICHSCYLLALSDVTRLCNCTDTQVIDIMEGKKKEVITIYNINMFTNTR